MIIGIPKEVKNHEYRVGSTPLMVKTFKAAGHTVYVERGAGDAIGYTDESYQQAGATLVDQASAVWKAELIIKVKEPQEQEFALMKEGQIIFCYFHLAADPEQTLKLQEKKVVAIAYEMVTDSHGRRPLLIPMSEIAGRLSIQIGAYFLQLNEGGKGVLLGGVPGVKSGKVTIVGGGYAGTEAARMALGLGADVTLLDHNIQRLRELDHLFGPNLKTMYATPSQIEQLLPTTDLLIGAVLNPGKLAPKLLTRAMMAKMEKKSLFVDISIDQGGCAETSRPTTHDNPVYVEEGVIHYCVTNMPGACARTATEALTNATSYYAQELANLGWKAAVEMHPSLKAGLSVCLGEDLTSVAVSYQKSS